MRICSTGVEADIMGTFTWVGDMGCSHDGGIVAGLVCDADICGVNEPASYLRKYFDECSHLMIGEAVKRLWEEVKGGYACAVECEGDTYVFRDPVGIKPLYYHGKTFASERKAFREKPRKLLPGELVKLPGTVVHRTQVEEVTTCDPEVVLDALRKSVHQTTEKNAAVLFSGGIDSSILAALSEAPLLTCGLEGSSDVSFSRKSAHLLKKECEEVVITERDITESIPEVLSFIEEKTLMNLEIGLLLFFICREWKGDVLISGQGADELFGGYSKYERAFHEKKDVKALMRRDFDHLGEGLERDGQVAERFNKRVRYPYLDLSLVARALGIPVELHFSGERKAFLRKVGTLLSLPDEVIFRPKKALQYGSGIHKVVKKVNPSLV